VEGAAAIEVGDGVIILELSSLLVADDRGARLVLGDGTRLARAVHVVCSTSVEIGPGVSSSDHATVTDSWALLAPRQGPVPPPPPAPVIIESGAYLGFGCIVGPGVRVGEGAFVGEGAVVLDDVEPHSVVYGNPAAPVRRYDRAAACWTERQLL
jgi:acetyltransferase-like isoleucine patch superfamily enzyme